MHGSYDKTPTKKEPIRTLRFTLRQLFHGIKLITSITLEGLHKIYYLVSRFAQDFCNRWHVGEEKIENPIHVW